MVKISLGRRWKNVDFLTSFSVDKCTQPIDPSLSAIENECVAVTSSQVEIISESSQTQFKRPSDYAQLIKTPEKLATKPPASSAILEAPIKRFFMIFNCTPSFFYTHGFYLVRKGNYLLEHQKLT